jgi:G3E family GTPase
MAPTPITIITGFLGAGKTTLILNLIPQLPPTYRLALLKNEFGDVAVDSQLATSAAISGVRELLNGCICCNLVGQLGDALDALLDMKPAPDRIIIETSGSAFPATLAMEVNRIGREGGRVVLDGVVSVIDVENWTGYEDISVTARMQAKYTDLIVYNKWEVAGEEAYERAVDRVGDLDVQIASVRSEKGWVSVDVVMGIDGGLIRKEGLERAVGVEQSLSKEDGHGHEHGQEHEHQSEVEVLSVVLEGGEDDGVALESFEDLLLAAPKDEVYRIKGLILTKQPPPDSAGTRKTSTTAGGPLVSVLNWAFSRWQYTPLAVEDVVVMNGAVARLTFILARGESAKWKKKLEAGDLVMLEGRAEEGRLTVKKVG